MTELLTAARMRAIEGAAIESGEVTGLELMERAGQGVVEAIFEEWPALEEAAVGAGAEPGLTDGLEAGLEAGGPAPQTPRSISQEMKRAVVLCGPGNNGGDGFVVARLLKARGWAVEVFLYGDPETLPPDARTNYERWVDLGEVDALSLSGFRRKHPVYGNAYADVYVDALFGTGLTRALEGAAFDVMRHVSGVNGDDYWRRTVAIDAPSGVCLDSGRVLAQTPDPRLPEVFEAAGREPTGARPLFDRAAALTVAFDSPKIGHFVGDGPALCGKIVIKDIGLENWRCFKPRGDDEPAFVTTERGPTGVLRPEETRLVLDTPLVPDLRSQRWTPLRRFGKETVGSHKYTHGHALVLTGGAGRTGAARLAARGALRVGAGLVTLGVPGAAQMEVAAQITALMLKRTDDADGLAQVLDDGRITALCLGPGMGLERARALMPVALGARRATVLDADALTAFADDPETLFDNLHDKVVLTPHGGEFARLFPDIAAKLKEPPARGPAYSKVDATREAARRAGCVVLFKGPDTVIAAPDGRCSINAAVYDRSAPWLATAGSGDVLAGFITGLLARGFGPMEAAEAAAWLHVECARIFGPGLIAEDLPDRVPAVFRKLGA